MSNRTQTPSELDLRLTALSHARESGYRVDIFGRAQPESPKRHIERARAYYDFITQSDSAKAGVDGNFPKSQRP